jgi:hypothetical protein
MDFERLMPLRVPDGWMVIKNQFADEDPIIENGRISNETSFTDDLLSIEKVTYTEGRWQNDSRSFCLDLGWVPGADSRGAFRLSFLKGDWNNVLFQVSASDRYYIRQVIERCLAYGTLNLPNDEIARRLKEEFIGAAA